MRSEPQVAPVVFSNGFDIVIRQAVEGGETLE